MSGLNGFTLSIHEINLRSEQASKKPFEACFFYVLDYK
nr:Hypothetical protein ECE5_0008 [Clostridioides difficile]